MQSNWQHSSKPRIIGVKQMTPITFQNFLEQNEILFLELAYDTGETIDHVANEHYQEYLITYEDVHSEY